MTIGGYRAMLGNGDRDSVFWATHGALRSEDPIVMDYVRGHVGVLEVIPHITDGEVNGEVVVKMWGCSSITIPTGAYELYIVRPVWRGFDVFVSDWVFGVGGTYVASCGAGHSHIPCVSDHEMHPWVYGSKWRA